MIFKMARPDDIKGVIDLCNLVFRSESSDLPNMGEKFPQFLAKENADNLAIAVDKGQVIAHLGVKLSALSIYGHALKYASIGAVCTHPDYRGRGIASSLQHMILKHLAARLVPLVTISGDRGLYTRNGAIFTGGQTIYDIIPSQIPKKTLHPNISISVLHGHENTESLSYAYHKESVRYFRSIQEFPILFKALPCEGLGALALTITAELNGKTLAYISGQIEGDTYKLNEYAGERTLILDLISSVSQMDNIAHVGLRVPYFHEFLNDLLLDNGLVGDKTFMGGTIRLVDAILLWESLLPIYDEIIGGDKMPRRWQDLDLSEVPGDSDEIKLLRFIFSHHERNWAGTPIPLPDPNGYNYI